MVQTPGLCLILLRREGYPCVFSADYHGAAYTDQGRDGNAHEIVIPSHRQLIDTLLSVRGAFTFGEQRDYFDHANVIGWTFSGDAEHPGAMAVLMSNGSEGRKAMHTGMAKARFIDRTGYVAGEVETDEEGMGNSAVRQGRYRYGSASEHRQETLTLMPRTSCECAFSDRLVPVCYQSHKKGT